MGLPRCSFRNCRPGLLAAALLATGALVGGSSGYAQDGKPTLPSADMSPAAEGVLYRSSAFTVTDTAVLEGDLRAWAPSRRKLRSTYYRTAAQRVVNFKFSLNGRDNERPPGQDHRIRLNWAWASAEAGHGPGTAHAMATIYRSAALALSNKENLVAATGRFASTAVNSNRQLWSVAGTLATVYRILFGIETRPDRLCVRPVRARGLRRHAHPAGALLARRYVRRDRSRHGAARRARHARWRAAGERRRGRGCPRFAHRAPRAANYACGGSASHARNELGRDALHAPRAGGADGRRPARVDASRGRGALSRHGGQRPATGSYVRHDVLAGGERLHGGNATAKLLLSPMPQNANVPGVSCESLWRSSR